MQGCVSPQPGEPLRQSTTLEGIGIRGHRIHRRMLMLMPYRAMCHPLEQCSIVGLQRIRTAP